MKVIEKKGYEGWKHKFTCSRCESVLEADAGDVAACFHPSFDDQRSPQDYRPEYWSYAVKCEVCGQEHDILEKSMPALMKHELQEKSKRRSSNYMDR